MGERFLRSIINREFIRTAIIPLLIIELSLLILYFSINTYINNRTTETLLDETRESVKEISFREARSIDLQLRNVSNDARMLQSENQRVFEHPDAFPLIRAEPEFGRSDKGIVFKSNNNGGAALCFLDQKNFTVGVEERKKAVLTEAFDPLFRAVCDRNPSVVAVYFNSSRSMCRYYPFTDDFHTKFDPDMCIPEFNFYYEANKQHNPEGIPVWTTVYLDPARQGWMASCIVPIYREEFLEGVTGIDITVDRFVDKILALELPWDASAFFVDQDGMILAMPGGVEEILGLQELRDHEYSDSVKQDTFKPREFNLLKNPNIELQERISDFFGSRSDFTELAINGKKYLLSQNVIDETGWKLFVLVDEEAVFEPIMALESLARRIGYAAIAFMALFYAAFLLFLTTRARRLAARVSTPLEEFSDATTRMAENIYSTEIEPVGISEIDRLARNFNTMSASVREEIARREKLLEELDESGRKFRNLVESTNAIPWEANLPLLRMNYIGPQAVSLFGYPIDDWQKIGFWKECIHSDDRAWVSSSFATEIAASRDFDLEYRMIASCGRVVWVHNVVTLETGENGIVRGFFFDITRQNQARETLREKEELLQQSQKMEAVGRLAGGMAHDFNNVLTVIKGYTDPRVLKETGVGDPVRRNMEEIRRAADRAAGLTRRLLSFSRKEPVHPRVMNPNDAITGIVEMLDQIIGDDVELTLSLQDGLWNIMADPGQIAQIVMNLAVNSRDAMPQGGKLTIATSNETFDRKSSFEGVKPGSYIRLTVTDSGCGMSQELLSRIFDPFFTTKETGKGTGLGLSIVFGIVTQNNGHLQMESDEGKGTRCTIYLPRVKSDEQDEDEAASNGNGLLEGSETVLLVEDDDILRGLTRNILEDQGYTVLLAEDGKQGLDIFKDNCDKIDLIVTDAVMPRMGGKALADEAVGIRPDIRVLFVSGYADETLEEQGLCSSSFNFLSKPFTPSQLLTKIREVLANPAANLSD